MYGWTDQMRVSARSFITSSAAEAVELFAKARAMIADPAKADLGLLLRAQLDGVASHVDVEFYRLRQLTDELGHVTGQLPAAESFFEQGWRIRPDLVELFCPDRISSLFDRRSNDMLDTIELLEACPNERRDFAWPRSLAGFMRRPRRHPFRAYSTADAAVYVHPFRVQVVSRDLSAMWDSGSPRSLSRDVVSEAPRATTDRSIVVVQDRFGFGNFCHFLFDGATRILHYLDHFGYRDELFVLGGIPGSYQELVGQALCDLCRIPESSLYFPDRSLLLEGARKCVWFSDQKDLHAHPAQMAHPQSLSLLEQLTNLVPGSSPGQKRLYISRGDAGRRRIVNEPQLVRTLEQRGFVAVELAGMPVQEQVGLFRDAEVVVAPHGMGLTHIAMSRRLGRVIELFHPTAGTDAYAFIARSAGMNYDYVLGTGVPATHSDFSVDVGQVLEVLGAEGTPIPRPNWRKRANLIPSSATFHGFQGGTSDFAPELLDPDFCPLVADQACRFHKKVGVPGNTLVGQWPNIDIIPETAYVASCWVWLPKVIAASQVSIRIDGWVPGSLRAAVLSKPREWQKISFCGISPKSVRRCAVSLHVIGHEGASLVSTCWQLERNLQPSSYLATP